MRRQGWKGRNEIACRLATLMAILAQRRTMPSIAFLARELEVHPRTVYRDLAAVEAACWPMPQRRSADGPEAW